ncbi:hypothetical protein SH661x_000391 [Planctomicrobium sp. SH661]|uniref:hypothetical protein n=1 Tax=Planctomicrobium sp. SH661 TaxID=3448124 RepID=UPI003F5C5C5A
MISDAIDKLAMLTRNADHPKVIPELSDNDRVALYVPGKKDIDFQTKSPTPRLHQVGTLSSLVEAAKLFGVTERYSIWVSMSQIVVVLDHDNASRRDSRVTMKLEPHVAFSKLEKSGWKCQQEIVDFLRHDLCDCTIDPPQTLDALKSLKFASQAETTGKISATTAGMGKSVAAQVTGETALPETVSFEFHPFPAFSEEVDVNVIVMCTLFSNPMEEVLKIEPHPGQLDEAKQMAQLAIVATLKQSFEETPIFVGVP